MPWLLLSLFAWFGLLLLAQTNRRRGMICNKPYGIRGCGGDDAPEVQMPTAPVLKTADELYGSATKFGKTESPLAYGAREGALSDLSKGTDYYSSFQPTSMEQVLADQYFQSTYPEAERSYKHGLSMAGIDSSPVLAEGLGNLKGNLSYEIGKYLSDLGNSRATNSLNARLNIDPYSTYSNYLNTDVNQSNNQANLNYQNALMRAQQDYQNAIAQYQQKQAGISSMFGMGGAGIGGILGGFSGGNGFNWGNAASGAALGSSAGGTAAPLFGGSSGGGMDLGSALKVLQMFGNSGSQTGQTQSVNPTYTDSGYESMGGLTDYFDSNYSGYNF